MSELLRFNLKKNTAIFFNNDSKKLKKFYLSYKKINKSNKINEFRGYSWYLKKLNRNKKNHLNITNNLNYLELPTILGVKYPFWKQFIFQKKKIDNIIKHYKKIWPKGKTNVPFHGDLTLDNIIFVKNKIFFIDWENFKKKEKWGLDLAFFLISLVVLPAMSQKNKIINNSDIHLFKNFWKNLFRNKKYNYLKDPIKYINNVSKKKNFFSNINIRLKKQIYDAIK